VIRFRWWRGFAAYHRLIWSDPVKLRKTCLRGFFSLMMPLILILQNRHEPGGESSQQSRRSSC
jgi:hypothetical protein